MCFLLQHVEEEEEEEACLLPKHVNVILVKACYML